MSKVDHSHDWIESLAAELGLNEEQSSILTVRLLDLWVETQALRRTEDDLRRVLELDRENMRSVRERLRKEILDLKGVLRHLRYYRLILSELEGAAHGSRGRGSDQAVVAEYAQARLGEGDGGAEGEY